MGGTPREGSQPRNSAGTQMRPQPQVACLTRIQVADRSLGSSEALEQTQRVRLSIDMTSPGLAAVWMLASHPEPAHCTQPFTSPQGDWTPGMMPGMGPLAIPLEDLALTLIFPKSPLPSLLSGQLPRACSPSGPPSSGVLVSGR